MKRVINKVFSRLLPLAAAALLLPAGALAQTGTTTTTTPETGTPTTSTTTTGTTTEGTEGTPTDGAAGTTQTPQGGVSAGAGSTDSTGRSTAAMALIIVGAAGAVLASRAQKKAQGRS